MRISKTITTLYNAAISYLFHLGAVAVLAWAASHGFHVSVPVIPASLGTFTGLAFVKMVLHNLGQSWHSGRLEAELVKDFKGVVSAATGQVISAAEGK